MKKGIRLLYGILISILILSSVNAQVSKSINVNVVDTRDISITHVAVDDVNLGDFFSNRAISNTFIKDVYPLADDGLITKPPFSLKVPGSGLLSPSEQAVVFHNLDLATKLMSADYGVGIVRSSWIKDRFGVEATGLTYSFIDSAVLAEVGQIKTVAHEIGHKGPFKLCDESSQLVWLVQDLDRIFTGGCPNGDLNNNGFLDNICINNDGCPTSTFDKLYRYETISDGSILRNFMGRSDSPDIDEKGTNLGFESWVSKDTYNALLDELERSESVTTSGLIISFFLFTDGNIEIESAYVSDDLVLSEQDDFIKTDGNFTVRSLDSNSNILANISFDVDFNFVTETGELIPTNVTPVTVVLPFLENVSKFDIINASNETIAEVNRTTSTPSLSLTFPTGGETVSQQMTVQYNAIDSDNDTLAFAILISDDNGATFSTLVVDHPDKTFFLNTTPFTDSDQYKIKILATDGINTDTEISGTFTINNSIIVAPGNFEFKKVKTKCGEGKEKDYIHIRGKMEGFEPASDFNIEIKGNPAIFGPVTVTIPFGTKTVAISEGKVQASFPNDGTGNFHINVDADNLNECPSGVLEADLILSLNGVKKTITLERKKNSKFFSTPNLNNLISGLAFWWLSLVDMITFFN